MASSYPSLTASRETLNGAGIRDRGDLFAALSADLRRHREGLPPILSEEILAAAVEYAPFYGKNTGQALIDHPGMTRRLLSRYATRLSRVVNPNLYFGETVSAEEARRTQQGAVDALCYLATRPGLDQNVITSIIAVDTYGVSYVSLLREATLDPGHINRIRSRALLAVNYIAEEDRRAILAVLVDPDSRAGQQLGESGRSRLLVNLVSR